MQLVHVPQADGVPPLDRDLSPAKPRLRGRAPDDPPRDWQRWLLWGGLLAVAMLAALALTGSRTGHASIKVAEAFLPRGTAAGLSRSTAVLPPLPLPQDLKPIAPAEAIAINAATPLADVPNPAAAPFRLHGVAPGAQAQAADCLTAAVYYEAATEPLDGQRAVAQVVLNRVRHPAYPNSVCGVVFQGSERPTGCQFTFTCDGSLARQPAERLWAQARRVAEQALAGRVHAPVGHATHYHANYVVPYWASSLHKVAVVGNHLFYRWQGGWGEPRSFSDTYAGVEPALLGRAIAASVQTATAFLPNAAPIAGVTATTPTSNILVPDPVLHADAGRTARAAGGVDAGAAATTDTRLPVGAGALKADLNRPQLRAELAAKGPAAAARGLRAPRVLSDAAGGTAGIGSPCPVRSGSALGPIGSSVVRAQPVGTAGAAAC